MFFLERQGPPDLAPERILGLRISLNTPVMAGSDLPTGPGRAAILVHEEPDGRPNVTIGVRSLQSGDVVLYSYNGDLREESSVAVGADAALSFAESMGFLFDEEEVDGARSDSRGLALGLWAELMGGGAPAPQARRATSPEPEVVDWPEGLLELDQVVEAGGQEEGEGTCVELVETLPPGAQPEALSAEPPGSTPGEVPAPALTKFRAGTATSGRLADGSAGAKLPTQRGGAALGKLQLVKKRSGSRSGSEERRGWLLRLFSAF